MNCPDDDFIFQQQKIVFRRLRNFFLSLILLVFFSLQLLLAYVLPLQQIQKRTILNETAHRRRDDVVSLSLFFFLASKLNHKQICEGENEEFLLFFYV